MRVLVALLLASVTLMAPAHVTAQAGAGRVQMGVLVRPDTVTVGDHFLVSVRVRGPEGTTFDFPQPPTEGRVEAVESPRLLPAADTVAVEQTMIYRLVAWDTGAVAIPLGAVTATVGGTARSLPIAEAQVYVRSVLPTDTALHDPRPARGIFGWLRPWWHWLIGGLIALGIIALLLWLLSRLRRRKAADIREDVPPIRWAEAEFDRIETLRLLESGERGRYVALYVEVMRDYFAARLSDTPTSYTSTELLDAVRDRAEVPVERLAPILAEADLIKFARRAVSEARARELAVETRGVVVQVERSVSAREEAEKAKEAAQMREREAVPA